MSSAQQSATLKVQELDVIILDGEYKYEVKLDTSADWPCITQRLVKYDWVHGPMTSHERTKRYRNDIEKIPIRSGVTVIGS